MYDPFLERDTRPAWFRFNGDFEYELASWPGPYRPASMVQRLNLELAPVMALLGGPEDVVLEGGVARGAVRPGAIRYVPWGVTPSTLAEAAQLDPEQRFPPIEAVRRVQHRRFGLEIEQRLGLALPGSRFLDSMEALDEAVREASGPFVIKHPFGVAGRERAFGRAGSGLAPGARAWCARALDQVDGLVFEPWVERGREFGIQLWLPEAGPPVLWGVLELLTDPNGTYRGHRFGAIDRPDWIDPPALAIAAAVREAGYFGPLGIDAFEYRVPDGTTGIRPLVELNARHTMGMCAIGLEKCLPPRGVGIWTHLDVAKGIPPEVARALEENPYDPVRKVGVLRTSPAETDGRPASRLSILTVTVP